MLKTIRFFCLLVLLAGCTQTSEDNKTATAIGNTSPSTTNTSSSFPVVKATTPKHVLHVVQRTHLFSSSEHPDYFRLVLHGDSITAGQIDFTITTREGRIIHRETFPASELAAALVNDNKKPTVGKYEREAFIIKRMEEFVQPDDFVSPAITAKTPSDTAYSTLSTQNQKQNQKNTIGFKYLLGNEKGRLLVFDPEKKKAVRYGSFGG